MRLGRCDAALAQLTAAAVRESRGGAHFTSHFSRPRALLRPRGEARRGRGGELLAWAPLLFTASRLWQPVEKGLHRSLLNHAPAAALASGFLCEYPIHSALEGGPRWHLRWVCLRQLLRVAAQQSVCSSRASQPSSSRSVAVLGGWAGGEVACLCLLPPLLTATSSPGHVPTHLLVLTGPPCRLPPLSTLPPRAPGPAALRCLCLT